MWMKLGTEQHARPQISKAVLCFALLCFAFERYIDGSDTLFSGVVTEGEDATRSSFVKRKGRRRKV